MTLSTSLALGLGLGLTGRGAAQQDPADWPGLVFWPDYQAGSGASLTDKAGNVAGLAITESGTGDAWANAGAFTTAGTANNTVFASTSDRAPEVIRHIGTRRILIHADWAISGGRTSEPIQLGFPGNANQRGFCVLWNNSSSALQFRAGGADEVGALVQFTATPALKSVRAVMDFLFDPEENTVGLWINGTLFEERILDKVPGTIMVADSGAADLKVGVGTSAICDAVHYHHQLYYLTDFPSNAAAIMAELAARPGRLPNTLKGLT